MTNKLLGSAEYPTMTRPQRGRDSSSFTPRLGRELESDEEVSAGAGLGPGLSPGLGLGSGLNADDMQGVRL